MGSNFLVVLDLFNVPLKGITRLHIWLKANIMRVINSEFIVKFSVTYHVHSILAKLKNAVHIISVFYSYQFLVQKLIKAYVLGYNWYHIHVFDAHLDVKIEHISRNSVVGLLCLCFHDHNLVCFEIKVNKVFKVVWKQKLRRDIVLQQSWEPLYVVDDFPAYFFMWN